MGDLFRHIHSLEVEREESSAATHIEVAARCSNPPGLAWEVAQAVALVPQWFPARAMAPGASAVWLAPLEPDTLLAQMVGFSLQERGDRLPGLGLPTLKEWQKVERRQRLALADHPQVASLVAGRG